MNKRWIAGCLAMAGAAVLGNWIWSDPAATPTRNVGTPHAIVAATVPNSEAPAGLIRSREIVEIIDLARVFEPTGDEYALQTLLANLELEDPLPQPRIVETPNPLRFLRQKAILLFTRIYVEWMNQSLILEGMNLPMADIKIHRLLGID